MSTQNSESDELQLAKSVQQACIEAAHDGFQDASMNGLCSEGAIEAAVSAIQKLDIEQVVKKQK